MAHGDEKTPAQVADLVVAFLWGAIFGMIACAWLFLGVLKI